MSNSEKLLSAMEELVKVTKDGFEHTHALIADVRQELIGDIARVANMTGAGFQTMNKRFDDVDERLKQIIETLEELKQDKE